MCDIINKNKEFCNKLLVVYVNRIVFRIYFQSLTEDRLIVDYLFIMVYLSNNFIGSSVMINNKKMKIKFLNENRNFIRSLPIKFYFGFFNASLKFPNKLFCKFFCVDDFNDLNLPIISIFF